MNEKHLFETFIPTITFIVIFFLIAEFFGRSKHIGRWWTFFLLFGIFPGIIALIFSPSAKKKPTIGTKTHSFFGYLFLLFSVVSIFSNLKNFDISVFFATTSILTTGIYLLTLSKSEIINSNPKFYFDNVSIHNVNKEKSIKPSLMNIKNNLKELKESGLLTELEYLEKIKKMEDDELNNEILKSDEYLKLKQLLDANILSKNEFDDKLKLIVRNYP